MDRTSIKNAQFYMKMEVVTYLFNQYESRKEGGFDYNTGDEFGFDIIEQPFHCVVKAEEGTVLLSVFIRSQWGIYDEDSVDLKGTFYSNGEEPAIESSGRISGNVSAVVLRFFKAGSQLCRHILDSTLMDDLADLDLEHEGIMVNLSDDDLVFKRVAGKKRPSMACTSLFGGVQMMRPYADELMNGLISESMTFEDNLEAAEAGDDEAMGKVALAYLNGDDEANIEQNAEKAAYWFRKQAELDNPTGCFNLGIMYLNGSGTAQSFDQALYWFQKADENGDSDAAPLIEFLQTIVDLQKKVECGDTEARAELAEQLMALGARSGDNDSFYKKSVELAEQAAAEKIPLAYWVLALAYQHGRGVSQNSKKAFECYEQGAEAGHSGCINNLAICYRTGRCVPEDQEKAFELSLQAAEMGNALAMRNVGECYQFGTGVEESMKKAIYWYEKALEENYDPELAQKVEIFKSIEEDEIDF